MQYFHNVSLINQYLFQFPTLIHAINTLNILLLEKFRLEKVRNLSLVEQKVENWFCHTRNLKILSPTSAVNLKFRNFWNVLELKTLIWRVHFTDSNKNLQNLFYNLVENKTKLRNVPTTTTTVIAIWHFRYLCDTKAQAQRKIRKKKIKWNLISAFKFWNFT